MEQVQLWLNGEWDYLNIRGGTGPLVYPAGHIYIYTLLYYITNNGSNIIFAQYLFMFLYLIMILILFMIYHESKSIKIPYWVFLLLCSSRRIHSIFMLRLFNDCFAMSLLYLAILFFIRDRWSIGCFLYSLAVGVKMNILLFAPSLLILLLQRFGIKHTFPKLGICAIVQFFLALPFLMKYPLSYFIGAFNFGRVFLYKWTVNWKFLSTDVFVSKSLALFLLVSNLILLLAFAHKHWCRRNGGLIQLIFKPSKVYKALNSTHILAVMFTGNFIGIVCARSLHYQFYSWYYHQLPFLLWAICKLPHLVRLLLILTIEIIWNIYPSTAISSSVLLLCHIVILSSLWLHYEDEKIISIKKKKT